MQRYILIVATLLLALSCGKDRGDDSNTPTPNIPTDELIKQLDRKPFYTRNPVSSAPSAEVESERYRLEFANWGNDDPTFSLSFPTTSSKRIIMEYTMCSEGDGPADYDNLTMLFIKDKATRDWHEITRAFTPFGGMFDSSWEKSFYIDVTDFQTLLQGDVEFRYHYSGFDATAEKAHAFRLRFRLYEGEPQRKLLAIENIYDSYSYGNSGYKGWAYGVEGHDIEADERLGKRTVTIPAGTTEMELRLSITGHGHDMGTFPDIEDYVPQNMAEFVENSYTFKVDGYEQSATGRIFYSNADNYTQLGTYNYDRANWAPGNPANVQYWSVQRSVPKSKELTIDIDLPRFVSSFTSPNAEGVAQYVVEADILFYAN